MHVTGKTECSAEINVALKLRILMLWEGLNHDYIKFPFIRGARKSLHDANSVETVNGRSDFSAREWLFPSATTAAN